MAVFFGSMISTYLHRILYILIYIFLLYIPLVDMLVHVV